MAAGWRTEKGATMTARPICPAMGGVAPLSPKELYQVNAGDDRPQASVDTSVPGTHPRRTKRSERHGLLDPPIKVNDIGGDMRLSPTATLGERVADGLRRGILSGDLRPGSELKQDVLADKFGVSRVPVREALQMLGRDGLVVVQPNRRVVVSILTEEDLMDRYAVRALIEGEAAARAAAARADLSSFRTAWQGYSQAQTPTPFEDFLAESARFHRAIWDAAGGSCLSLVASQLWSGRDYTPSNLTSQVERATREHQAVADAIEQGDEHAAREAMVRHIMSTAAELRSYRSSVSSGGAER